MLFSRMLSTFRQFKAAQALMTCRSFSTSQAVRGGHAWTYREPPHPPSKVTIIKAEVIGGFMWWWILWHLWHDYEHITGEFPYPDPLQWTDEELGIPPDDD